ncbi:hypothetical protein H1C71_013391 [Ictidomys tridecemlineatus]|uniref:uncharacterized protein C12orf71 homolog n=1 Tax=Ictidomys tridecemlineatus TaxID=43179 RepID=UPI000B539D5B|nr:uncharacterized protein C12orf71 homolog [Ictidomys tridecemlineatus]KAG3292116.1 hypothetical protein H1C71_013391 [Ictidomys tridecemlineatus]
MGDSSLGSSPDVEQCVLESSSNQSLSVGYFPHDDGIDCEDIIPCEELTSEGPSCHVLPPVQGAWGSESVIKPVERQNPIQENPEKPGEEAILEVLDAYLEWHQEDSGANGTPKEDSQRMDECPQESINQTLWDVDELMKDLEAFMESQKVDQDHGSELFDSPPAEDLQPCTSASSDMDQVSDQESEACEDLPKCDPPENGDMDQFPEMPPELEDDEIVEMESQEICTAETSVSSEPSKEEDGPSEEENTCCLNLSLGFKWLRKRVVSALTGRNRPRRANNSSILLSIRRRHLFGGNKVHPQESL